MTRKAKLTLLLLFLLALPCFLSLEALTPQNQMPPSDGGSGGGSCSYCASGTCGCGDAPVGCTLSYSCGCSSISCWHSCSYNCR